MNYRVLINGFNGGAVLDALPSSSPADWRFGLGVSLASEFPSGGVMRFSPNFPDQIRILDFVSNTLGLLVVSVKVRRILEKLGADNCEFLPVQLHDHKGRVASQEHAVLNLLGSQDVIDMERSRYDLNPLDPGQIMSIEHLVLKPNGIDPKALLFRAKTMMMQYFLHPSVEEAFTREGVTGFMDRPANGWDGMPF